ncbi:glycoside hydrolase family 25 protein [Corynebacterium ulcerans]|uniref:glycoside hydrolase family 25 protein n=1 Tax=Corynebacterium ulcerans TaxID=65058 RepID=UPI0002141712|nr:glycoside hydrolase family 25 protein [Corynebacterium ulcerans]AEG84508.1 family 25 glycoside hydrolase [Corynebacterium ulcerans BR-AD22]MDK8887593.1 glycoside hydrolase family 25 protein [Corynebacterium ulcerans]
MTIYGVDVSEHQNGISLVQVKKEGYDFAILRLCDGTYRDRTFRSHLADAENAGLLISLYWYLRAPSEGTTIAQQVDVIDSQLGGRKDLAIWIDVESVTRTGVKTLSGSDVWNAKRELESRGYTVAGIYSGAWYWEHMIGGEPSMAGLGYLWVSNYGRNLNDYGSVTYEADGGPNHRGWKYPLGDKMPDILQFGSNGKVAGFRSVDVNAFEGTIDELRHIFAA